MYQPPALQAVFHLQHTRRGVKASERAGSGTAACSNQQAKTQRIRGTRAAGSVSNNARRDERGGPPLAIIPFAQPTNGTPLCLFLFPPPVAFTLSPAVVFNPVPTHRPPLALCVRGLPCPALQQGDISSGPPARPAQQLASLASAQVTHSWPPPKAHART
jgi:hypothetical protein